MTRFLEHPLVQLTLVRAREFLREPEAIFWAVLFPIVLSVGLGLAFRERPEPVLKIAASPELAAALRTDPHLDVTALDAAAARTALRDGKVALAVDRGADGSLTFRYDDTNPEGRAARTMADRAIQRAAGRVDPVRTAHDLAREPGARYIDFLLPGPGAIGITSNAVWCLGFSIVDTRRRKLTKRLMATPMSRPHYLGSCSSGGSPCSPSRSSCRSSSARSCSACRCADLDGDRRAVSPRIDDVQRDWHPDRQPCAGDQAVSGMMNLVIMPMWIVQRVLLGAALSRSRAADHPGAAAHLLLGAARRQHRARRSRACGSK